MSQNRRPHQAPGYANSSTAIKSSTAASLEPDLRSHQDDIALPKSVSDDGVDVHLDIFLAHFSGVGSHGLGLLADGSGQDGTEVEFRAV